MEIYASSMYVQYKVTVSENQVDTLKDAIRLKGVTLFSKRCFTLCCSCTAYNFVRIGLLSGGINKAISGSGAAGGDRLNLHKHDKCYQVHECDGLYLAPHPRFVEGDRLFLKHGEDISDGAGLLMWKNSLFKNILVLGWLL